VRYKGTSIYGLRVCFAEDVGGDPYEDMFLACDREHAIDQVIKWHQKNQDVFGEIGSISVRQLDPGFLGEERPCWSPFVDFIEFDNAEPRRYRIERGIDE
jgi:hypothetical protein